MSGTSWEIIRMLERDGWFLVAVEATASSSIRRSPARSLLIRGE